MDDATPTVDTTDLMWRSSTKLGAVPSAHQLRDFIILLNEFVMGIPLLFMFL